MSEQYLIVNTKILPDFYAKVVEARDLVEQHKVKRRQRSCPACRYQPQHLL